MNLSYSILILIICAFVTSVDIKLQQGSLRRDHNKASSSSSSSYGHQKFQLQVVITRFNEDVSHLAWLSDFHHIIYNRGDELPPSTSQNLNIITQYENVGRESFVYINHILHNYHRLADITVFSQIAHDKAAALNYTDADFQATVRGFHNKSLRFTQKNDGFVFLVPVCFNWQYGVKDWRFERDNYFKNLYQFEVPAPRFGPTGAFAITRELILRNPKSYYVSLVRTLGSENNPRIGHFMERTWPELFHSHCSAYEEYHCHTGNISNNTCGYFV